MLVLVGLTVMLVAVTVVLNMLTSSGGTHDSFAVLGQRYCGPLVVGQGDGLGMAQRIVGRRTARTTPDIAGTAASAPQRDLLKEVDRTVAKTDSRSR